MPGTDRHASAIATSTVVTRVFEDVLAAVHEGRLQPGERISDAALAEQLGVSRTPVREALLRLREIGVVEAAANRFTRVAVVTPHQTADALIVWGALYHAVISEVVPTVSLAVIERMRADHAIGSACAANGDIQGVATANLSFFSHLVAASANPTLQRSITSVVHIVRLGSMHLPERIEFDALIDGQRAVLDAVSRRDAPAAHAALEKITGIRVPQ
jgi:DNA-binding GntR family transcriptional regulator